MVRKAIAALGERCVHRMRNGALYGGWSRWRAMASEGVEARRKVGGALRRMLLRQLSMGFEKWQGVAMQMKEEGRKLRQAVMRMVARQLAGAFGRWREMAMVRKAIAALGERCVRRMSCLLYTSPSPRDRTRSRMPSSA